MPKTSSKTEVLKTCAPVILGYLPAGFAFGLLITESGYPLFVALAMSVFIYAGAGQFLAVGLLTGGVSLLQSVLATFFVNSKHLFYGLSLLEDYKNTGLRKLYLIFSLTDETYALLTAPQNKPRRLLPDFKRFALRVGAVNQGAWVTGTFAGALFGSAIKFDSNGMDFAMIALFVIILIEQLRAYRTKLPFIIGFASAAAALIIFGKSNTLLAGALMSGLIMVLLRKRIEKGNANGDENCENGDESYENSERTSKDKGAE